MRPHERQRSCSACSQQSQLLGCNRVGPPSPFLGPVQAEQALLGPLCTVGHASILQACSPAMTLLVLLAAGGSLPVHCACCNADVQPFLKLAGAVKCTWHSLTCEQREQDLSCNSKVQKAHSNHARLCLIRFGSLY